MVEQNLPLTGDELVRALWDIERIKQLKARYFRHVDSRDWVALHELFTSDCTFESEGMREVTNPEEFVRRVEQLITPGVSVHHGHMPEISLTGPDAAVGVWAMYDYLDLERPEGRRGIHGYGHYHEEYRREAGHWLISSWKLTRLRVDRF